jgi:hypothetical protein
MAKQKARNLKTTEATAVAMRGAAHWAEAVADEEGNTDENEDGKAHKEKRW